MNELGVQILVALFGSGALLELVRRLWRSKDRSQDTYDKYYAALEQREADMQKTLLAREDHWRGVLQDREKEWRDERKQREAHIDDVERQCLLCEAREQGYKDEIEAQHRTIARLHEELERSQRGRQ